MRHNLPLGVTFSLVASLLYSISTAIFKGQADVLPPLPVVVFLQNFIALLLILPIIFQNGLASAKKHLTTRHYKMHFVRSIFSLLISFSLFYSVKFIPLVNALLLSNAAPLIVPFVGYFFFREKINHSLWVPVILGYIGVTLILNPDTRIMHPAAVVAFSAAIALAFIIQLVRKLSATDSALTITFYFLAFCSLISGLIAVPFWEPINASAWMSLLAIGVLFASSQYLANAAMRYANPQLVSSLMYSNVLYATGITLIIWHTYPNLLTIIGTALVIFGSINCIRIEHRAQLETV